MNDTSIIGIIPAGGIASRLGPLPCSKELLPIGSASGQPVPVSTRLVQAYVNAGAESISWILRPGKWDIPAYFGSGLKWGVHMDYSVMEYPYGPPFTLNEAWNLFRGRTVLLGFPDILLNESDPFSPLVKMIQTGDRDVALGIVEAPDPRAVDVVVMEPDNRISRIIPKPPDGQIKKAWIWAAWSPDFSAFLHSYIGRKLADLGPQPVPVENVPEIHVGHVIDAFIHEGGRVGGIEFPHVRFLDIGTPENWGRASQFLKSHDAGGSFMGAES